MAEKIDYDLTEAEAALLLAVTKDVMSAAGGVGGGAGGAFGGRLGVRLTRPRTVAVTVDAPLPPDTARERLQSAVADHGRLIPDPNRAGDGSVWGIVDSGFFNMMPALVRASVEPTDTGRCQVRIRATGREGLVKQRIGAKAADRIAVAVAPG